MSLLSPIPFSYGRVERVALSSSNNFANDALVEVNMLAQGFPRYTVYRVSNAAKRVMLDDVVPVIQFDTAGNGTFVAVTPLEIWYAVGYFFLSTPRGATDVGRVGTGHYCTATQIFGCASRAPTSKTICGECTCDADTAVRRAPLYDDWSDRLEVFWAKLRSELTTTGGAANSHIKLEHLPGGVVGDNISIEITNPGGNGALAVTVVGNDITVAAARSSGTITSLARDVVRALNSSEEVKDLGVLATIAPGETGAGLVAVYAHTHLAGGMDKINYAALKGSTVVMKYYDYYATGLMWAGFGILESIDWSGDSKSFVKATIGISGARNPLYRVPE